MNEQDKKLRDKIAIEVMKATISNQTAYEVAAGISHLIDEGNLQDAIARMSYIQADAMLKFREIEDLKIGEEELSKGINNLKESIEKSKESAFQKKSGFRRMLDEQLKEAQKNKS